MRDKNTKYLIHAADTHKMDPVVAAVTRATEVGFVVPSILRKELESIGCKIYNDHDQLKQSHGFRRLDNLARCAVCNSDGEMIAHAVAGNPAEALLHALLGYIAERDIEFFGNRLPVELHQQPAPGKLFNEELDWPMTKAHRKNLNDFITARNKAATDAAAAITTPAAAS